MKLKNCTNMYDRNGAEPWSKTLVLFTQCSDPPAPFSDENLHIRDFFETFIVGFVFLFA
ncbi:MAG: hypothetical protein WBL02_05205 [Methanomethylovorans sp.]